MHQYIKLLSDLSYMSGLIGYSEYLERCDVADWLEDTDNIVSDPRLSEEEKQKKPENEFPKEPEIEGNANSAKSKKANDDEPPWLKLLILNKWMFTIGDVDCYPSVPHGHFQSKTKEWPKLNPYTGRVFSDVHKEDSTKRLNKRDMKKIWNDSSFIEHCRKQVIWYSDSFPSYGFPNARRGKLLFPRWR